MEVAAMDLLLCGRCWVPTTIHGGEVSVFMPNKQAGVNEQLWANVSKRLGKNIRRSTKLEAVTDNIYNAYRNLLEQEAISFVIWV